jgi:hypothetical protein
VPDRFEHGTPSFAALAGVTADRRLDRLQGTGGTQARAV